MNQSMDPFFAHGCCLLQEKRTVRARANGPGLETFSPKPMLSSDSWTPARRAVLAVHTSPRGKCSVDKLHRPWCRGTVGGAANIDLSVNPVTGQAWHQTGRPSLPGLHLPCRRKTDLPFRLEEGAPEFHPASLLHPPPPPISPSFLLLNAPRVTSVADILYTTISSLRPAAVIPNSQARRVLCPTLCRLSPAP